MAKKDACPACGEPTDPLHQPFCSRGCKDRDLLKWLSEGYRIPAQPADDDEADSGLDTRDGRDL